MDTFQMEHMEATPTCLTPTQLIPLPSIQSKMLGLNPFHRSTKPMAEIFDHKNEVGDIHVKSRLWFYKLTNKSVTHFWRLVIGPSTDPTLVPQLPPGGYYGLSMSEIWITNSDFFDVLKTLTAISIEGYRSRVMRPCKPQISGVSEVLSLNFV